MMSHSIRHISNGETSYDLYQVTCHSDPDTDPCYVTCIHLENGSIGHPSTGCNDPNTCKESHRTDFCVWTYSLETNAEEGLDYSYIGHSVSKDLPFPSGSICIAWVQGFGFGWYYLEEEPEGIQGFHNGLPKESPVAIPVDSVGRLMVELAELKEHHYGLLGELDSLVGSTSGYLSTEVIEQVILKYR